MAQHVDELTEQPSDPPEPTGTAEGTPPDPRDEGANLRVVPDHGPEVPLNEDRIPPRAERGAPATRTARAGQHGTKTSPDLRIALFQGSEKIAVYLICVVVLALAGHTLNRNLTTADKVYSDVLHEIQDASGASGTVGRDQLTTAVAVIGMRDMALLRNTVLFIGFIVILMGCVFVLKGVEAMYQLRLNAGDRQAAFSTASPGLVLITAGVVLVIVALQQESSVKLALEGPGISSPAGQATPAGGGQSVQSEGEVVNVNE